MNVTPKPPLDILKELLLYAVERLKIKQITDARINSVITDRK